MAPLAELLRRRLRRLGGLRSEAGMTLMELLVSLTAGLVVFGAITALMMMTIRQTGRVTSHVDANQRARTAMTKIVNELHSACFFPQVTPVQPKSEGNRLIFWHQSGTAVAPTPIQSTIELVNGELRQQDANPTTGGGKTWSNFTAAGPPETLMTGVSPLEGTSSVFTYYSYSKGKIASTPMAVPLTGETAGTAVQVNIGFKSAPLQSVIEDENSATGISNSVLLRLTPPSYDSSNDNPPCE